MGRKLTKKPLDLPPVGRDLIQTPPMVGLHTEVPQGVNTQNGAPSIANNNIQDPVVPPTKDETSTSNL